MSICPRCGKILCNEQALMYHLNKKTPCNSLKCNKCKKTYSSKFDLLICEKKCLKRTLERRTNEVLPSVQMRTSIENTSSPPNAKQTQTSPSLLEKYHKTSPPNAKRTQTSPDMLDINYEQKDSTFLSSLLSIKT